MSASFSMLLKRSLNSDYTLKMYIFIYFFYKKATSILLFFFQHAFTDNTGKFPVIINLVISNNSLDVWIYNTYMNNNHIYGVYTIRGKVPFIS